MSRSLREWRTRFRCQLAHARRWMSQPQLGDFDEVDGQGVDAERANRLELRVRGASGANEVRLVGIREAICAGSRRGDDRVLFQPQHGVACPGDREEV
jgi:hypothetical protein